MKASLLDIFRKNDQAALRKQGRRRRFQLESLEGRQLLSTFTVTNASDTGSAGSLRWAIEQSNATPSTSAAPNTIVFDFNAIDGGQGAQQVTIDLGSALPQVTQPLHLLGTLPDATPGVVLDGTNATTGGAGLQLGSSAPGSEVQGFVFSSFGEGAIDVSGSNDVISGNYIGLNAAGTGAAVNTSLYGIDLFPSSNNTVIEGNTISGNQIGIDIENSNGNLITANNIGTDRTGSYAVPNQNGIEEVGGVANTIGSGNVVSGNSVDGVVLIGTSNNVVEGNAIGTNRNGSVVIGNGVDGVYIAGDATYNTVGGTTSTSANIISGNNGSGVEIAGGGTTNNVVEGNFIGTNLGGTSSLGNGTGVTIDFSVSGNIIGGTGAGTANVISGNATNGVEISGGWSNQVEGNFIGTNQGGTAAVGNGKYGVSIDSGATGNIIGAGNVISGNANNGVWIDASSNNSVQGNLIGLNAAGNAALSNGGSGVWIDGQAQGNTIGGTGRGSRNVISGNSQLGVVITGIQTQNNVVEGNFIGSDATGFFAVPNRINGVDIVSGASDNTIGGTSAGAGNVISGNAYNGVVLAWTGTTQNTIEGNSIGVGPGGNVLANGSDGVVIQGGASSNLIGGTVAGAGNTIAGNGQQGVLITDPGTFDNQVAGNDIGIVEPGNLTSDGSGNSVGNGANGVDIANSATSNIIGGTTSGAQNVIANNRYNGVVLTDVGTSYNTVEGNAIGTDPSGTRSLANGADGVLLQVGASSNTIGGTAAGSANVVSGNLGWGVFITGSGTSDNVVEGDLIGTNAAGTAAIPNAYNGLDIVDGATGNTVGGTAAGSANVISGNAFNGVVIAFSGTSNNTVEGNLIGTNADGNAPLPNGSDGVVILGGATNNSIGGTSASSGNVISGNAGDGVLISDAGTSGNEVQTNLIGTDTTGTAAVPNHANGVAIASGASSNHLDGNVISGNIGNGVYVTDAGTTSNAISTDAIGTNISGSAAVPNGLNGVVFRSGASSNVVLYSTISGNDQDGVLITDGGTNNNVLEYNQIGVNSLANAVILPAGRTSSNADGVQLTNGAADNYLTHNVISGNYIGVEIDNSATGNSVVSNEIGVVTFNLNGGTFGNTQYDVLVNGSSGNSIDDNSIANSMVGIYFLGSPDQDGGHNAYSNVTYSDLFD